MENLENNIIFYEPYKHSVIDNFFKEDVAEQLLKEFPSYNDSCWFEYNSPLELKKTCNNWYNFPALTYKIFCFLNSKDFINTIKIVMKEHNNLYGDSGLHGAGWHLHGKGGKLNPHLDYSIHPKLKLYRKYNIIIYLNKEWKEEYGGSLGLWNYNSNIEPGDLNKEILPKFNRAVIFETSSKSWHGLSRPVEGNNLRKSLANYYLTDKEEGEKRTRALFSPSEEQKNDIYVLDLIKKRSK